MCSLVDKYKEIAKQISGSSTMVQLPHQTYVPYNYDIMVELFLLKFKVLQIEMYDDGSLEPIDHIETFKGQRIAKSWFGTLKLKPLIALKSWQDSFLHNLWLLAYACNQLPIY